MTKHLAPIIVFAFNRPDALQSMLSSLKSNTEAKDSDLFIFVDGPRKNKEGEEEMVRRVHEVVKNTTGFKTIQYNFSDANIGLGPSIIAGVSKIIDEYGKAIVIEDDLKLSSNFLAFMNDGLERYRDENKVFSICGYSNKVKVPKGYTADSYFCTRSSSWGWATWKDRWDSVDWELSDWSSVEANAAAFNKWGGSDCFSMLKGWHDGRNKSWAIRFCYSQFIQDKLSLFPINSKVDNRGFDGLGTNCKIWSRFKHDFDTSNVNTFTYPIYTSINSVLLKSALSYHSIGLRIFSKLMNMIVK